MVDNERLKAGKVDSVVEEACEIPSACCSAEYSPRQPEQLNVTDAAAVASDAVEDDTSSSAPSADASDVLRHVVIDGSNIAMSHGNRTTFSCRGIKLAVEWFQRRGHKHITVFVPQWRRESHKQECTVTDPEILSELEQEKVVVFTPSRKVRGKRIVCHDDRYIVKLATETDGVIVSNDTYRDLATENEHFRKTTEERLLMYSFVDDRFMPPDDPLGRHGPTLDDFLRKEPVVSEPRPPNCPYAKCTYGAKCRYSHPERASSLHRPSPSVACGDKLSGPAAVDSSGSSTNPCGKKKLTAGRRSYDKPNPTDKHLQLKPFHSDPTDCGHLVLARKLSHEFKPKSRHNLDSNVDYDTVECSDDKPGVRDDDNRSKPDNLHQRLRRQLAVQGSNDPRTANLARTYNDNLISSDHSYLDTTSASHELSLPKSFSDVTFCGVSSADKTRSGVGACASWSSSIQTEPVLPQRPLSSDPLHQLPAAGRSSQDHVPGARFMSPILKPTGTCMDSMYMVRPVTSPYDLQLCRQFPAPQLVPRIHQSPTWPQMYVYQSRSYLPQHRQTRYPVISAHRFLPR